MIAASDPQKTIRKEVRERMRNIGIDIGRGKCIVYMADGKGKVHDVAQNSSGPPMPGKIPEAFQASFVVAAQPAADPGGTTHQDANSLIHGHVKHADHAYRDHPGSNLVNLFARLFEFFPFYVVHVSLRLDLIYKLFDYLHTNFGALLWVGYLFCIATCEAKFSLIATNLKLGPSSRL